MSSEKQVTTKKTNLPSAGLFEADAQKGFENVKTESLAPPILILLRNSYMMVTKEYRLFHVIIN